jgi:hypothetical protein
MGVLTRAVNVQPTAAPPPEGINVTLLDSGHSTSSGPVSTGSITSTAGAVLFVFASSHNAASTTNEPQLSGLSGTWVNVSDWASGWGSRRYAALWACEDWTGSGTLTISGAWDQGVGWAVMEATGLDTAGTPYTKNEWTEFHGSDSGWSPTMTGIDAGDATLAFAAQESNEAFGHDAGWAELFDFGEATGMRRIGGWWDVDGDTTPALTWATSGLFTGITVELNPMPVLPSVDHWERTTMDDNTSPKTFTGLDWAAGDVIVVATLAANGNQSGFNFGATPTNANLSFDAPTTFGIGSGTEAGLQIYTAIAGSAQTGQTITVTRDNAYPFDWGATLWIVTDGSGVTNVIANGTEGTISRTVSAGSLGIYIMNDFNADTNGQTLATGTGTPTERDDDVATGSFSWVFGDWAEMAAGTFGFGVTDYTGLKVSHGFVEVLA